MKKELSYNYGRPVEKAIVPTLAQTIGLFDKLRKSGKTFRVDFIKRKDGSYRTMICRFGVKKYLKGGKRAYDATEKGLFVVYDWNRQAYRSFGIDEMLMLKVGGIVYWFQMPLSPGTYPIDDDFTLGGRTLPAHTTPMRPEPSEETVGAILRPKFNEGNKQHHHQW